MWGELVVGESQAACMQRSDARGGEPRFSLCQGAHWILPARPPAERRGLEC